MKIANGEIDKARILAVVLFTAFCLSIIPVLYAGFFCHPLADDFSFSFRVHQALLNGSSVLGAVRETVSEIYHNWQGTYSAVVLFSLQPGVFSPSSYFMTPFLMLGFLIASTFFLFHTLIRKIMKGKGSHVVILSCLTLIMSIQFVPDKEQTFYWFNGSAFYTLYYSFALVFFSLLMLLRRAESHRSVLFLASVALAIIIAGGNYTTALITAELLALFVILEFPPPPPPPPPTHTHTQAHEMAAFLDLRGVSCCICR